MSMDGNNDRDTDFNLWAMGDLASGVFEVGCAELGAGSPGQGGPVWGCPAVRGVQAV